MKGGNGHDFIVGGTQGDRLFGEAGNDRLYGDDGNDRISGGDGMDSIFDGAGRDTLEGGQQADVFHFSRDHAVDKVIDFADGQDKLDISDWGGYVREPDRHPEWHRRPDHLE